LLNLFKRDNPEKSIDDEIWLAYFSELSTVPPKFDKKIEELNEKVKNIFFDYSIEKYLVCLLFVA
jgi:hypothetical protein